MIFRAKTKFLQRREETKGCRINRRAGAPGEKINPKT